MRKWTWAEIKSKVQKNMDLIDDNGTVTSDFVTDAELLEWANQGIDEAETGLHGLTNNGKLLQKYFLTKANIALTSGTQDYALPSDIFGSKIVKLLYVNGATKYEIRQIHDPEETSYVQTTDPYRYIVYNPIDVQLSLWPTAQETSATNVTIWYIRNAKRLTVDADTCDIPEFVHFVMAFMKGQIMAKENAGVLPQSQSMEIMRQRALMKETLEGMIEDGDNFIEPDLSFYYDFDSPFDYSGGN